MSGVLKGKHVHGKCQVKLEFPGVLGGRPSKKKTLLWKGCEHFSGIRSILKINQLITKNGTRTCRKVRSATCRCLKCLLYKVLL